MKKIRTKKQVKAIKINIKRRTVIVDDKIVFKKKIPLPSWIELSIIDVCNRTCSFCPKSDPSIAPDTFQKMDQDGETRSYVRKNTQICTVHSGTYIIPSNFSEGGGVGQVFAPTVVQNCCFCNKSVSDFIDYRYGG